MVSQPDRRYLRRIGCWIMLIATGCHSESQLVPGGTNARHDPRPDGVVADCNVRHSSISLVSHIEPALGQISNRADRSDVTDPFAGESELDLDRLLVEVLKRNPSIPALVAAWQAAAQRYPQVVSLDDPMFGFVLGPATFGSNDVDFGWMIEGSQKVPWPGKRALRGQIAQAEADAIFHEITEARLKVSEAAKLAYFDYFLVERNLEINADNVRAMQEFRTIAQNRYEASLVTQQDVLQTDVELADLSRRKVELDRMSEVARARINTLLHRDPDHTLPLPPVKLADSVEIPAAELLRKLAIERRPDLASQSARIRAEEAAVELACKEFCPDLEFVARYDSFWQPAERDVRPQIGINLNLPIQTERRRAAVQEAIARVTQRHTELDRQINEIQYEVQAAASRLNESRRVVALYADVILPASRLNVDAARVNYEAGKLDFLRLIEAQRQLIGYREKQFESIAEFHRRTAELERVLAGPIPQSTE